MLWAAPTTALLTIPAVLGMEIDPQAHPDQIAYLFGMSLLGIWGTLASGKLLEGKTVSPWLRRGVNLGVEALVGLVGYLLATGLEIGNLPGFVVQPPIGPNTHVFGQTIPIGPGSPAIYAVFFGLLSFLSGSIGLTPRDRSRKFRLFPVLKAGAIGGLLGLGLHFPEPWGPVVAAISAAGIQAVSPWSKPAAVYAKYAAKQAKKARKQVA